MLMEREYNEPAIAKTRRSLTVSLNVQASRSDLSTQPRRIYTQTGELDEQAVGHTEIFFICGRSRRSVSVSSNFPSRLSRVGFPRLRHVATG